MTSNTKDLVTLNLSPDFKREGPQVDYERDRDSFKNASQLKMGKLNNRERETAPYRHVLTGIQEIGPFSKAFFSVENMNWLHSNIRFKVYELSGKKTVISRQKDSELLEVMRRVYLQNSMNPDSPLKMGDEMMRLNNLVLDDVVPRIISEVKQYNQYLIDINKIRTPISLPMNTSVIGTKLYERGPADVLGLYD